MPLYEFLCNSCGHQFEDIRSYDPKSTPIECPHECGRFAVKLPSRAGGYRMVGDNSSSTTPKGAGSPKRK